MNTTFDLSRLGYFMRRQLNMNLNSLWIALAAVLGTLLVISALFAYFNNSPYVLFGLRNLYLVVFFAGGFIFTSMVLNEMHSPKKSYAFLLLPASRLEKLIGAWLVSSPLYILLYAILFVALLFFSAQVAGRTEHFSLLFDDKVWNCVKVFFVTQPVFFLGATAFRGNNFLKTLLALFLFVLIIGLYSGLLGYLLFDLPGNSDNYSMSPGFERVAKFTFTEVIPFIFWFLLAPFMLVVSYFKLKERQV